MMQLPPGFNIHLLAADFLRVVSPFVGVVFLVSVGFLIIRLLKRV